jgi:hypothetical protein
MTVSEILQQAKTLTPQERKELVVKLVETLDVAEDPAEQPVEEHWGRRMIALMQSMDAVAFADPEITDPVEWVKAQRRKGQERLKPYWTGEK